jgi:hypothetical protein
MRHWTDTPCTCGVAKNKIKGAHHDLLCERMIARREQREALMARATQGRTKRKKAGRR